VSNPGGHLALQQDGRARVSEVMGHKGPVSFIGLGASGLEGPEPFYQSNVLQLSDGFTSRMIGIFCT
jgi:hypothetical protein